MYSYIPRPRKMKSAALHTFFYSTLFFFFLLSFFLFLSIRLLPFLSFYSSSFSPSSSISSSNSHSYSTTCIHAMLWKRTQFDLRFHEVWSWTIIPYVGVMSVSRHPQQAMGVDPMSGWRGRWVPWLGWVALLRLHRWPRRVRCIRWTKLSDYRQSSIYLAPGFSSQAQPM